MTKFEFDTMLQNQNSQCKICKLTFDTTVRNLKPVVDHDHKTGKVRGMLCWSCNSMLGFSLDNPTVLEDGAKYIRSHNELTTTL